MAIVKNSPFGVIRGSIGETTFQLVNGNNIMRKKPYNTFKQTPHVPDWPYPIDEAVIAYVDNFYSINESFIQSTWASPNIDDGIEADFKRFNYLRCQLLGMSEFNISYGYGDFKMAYVSEIKGWYYDRGWMDIRTTPRAGETLSQGKTQIRITRQDSPFNQYTITEQNKEAVHQIKVYSAFYGWEMFYVRQIGYTDDRHNGCITHHTPVYAGSE